MQALARRFVPTADEVHALQRADTPEGRLFRVVAEQGHYAGRTTPTDTRQGIYACAPSGKLLASINTRSASAMADMLERALEAWEALPEAERYGEAPPEDGGWRWERRYPADGLVLAVHARDLPREDAPDDWRAEASNRDFAWFTAEEAAAFVPEPQVGAERALDPGLANRVARVHLVDSVRGQVPPFAAEDVERAALTSRVTAVDGERLELALRGATRTVRRGRWAVAGYEDMHAPSEQERGVEMALLGRATWDRAARRFTAFELVALGTRWGGTQYNGRSDDLQPGPMGVAFTLADPAERVAPAAIWAYGWR